MLRPGFARQLTELEYPDARFGGEHGAGLRRDLRRDQHFKELPSDDARGGIGVERAVEGDDAAIGGVRIGAVCGLVSRADIGCGRHAAGVRMLHDHAGRRLELAHALDGGVRIGDVVEGQFLAL